MQNYLDSPQYKALLAQALQGGPASQYPGQALANVGAQLANAWSLKDYERQQQGKEADYSKAIGSALAPQPVDNVAVTPAITGPGQMQQREMSGAYNQPTERDLMSKLLDTGNADVTKDFAPVFASEIARQQARATQPLSPLERINTSRQNRLDDPAYIAQRAAAERPTPEYAGQVAAAQREPVADAAARANALRPSASYEAGIAGAKAGATLPYQIQLEQEKNKAALGDADTIEKTAKMISTYQMAPLSGFSLAKPGGQAIMARVGQLNPQYNAQNFTKSQQAYKDFGSGRSGNLVRSFNVSISHLGTLDNLVTALANQDVQAVNQIQNTFKSQFGSTAPTNFSAAKAIVGDEIIKAIVGGGGALADRESAQNQISAANTSDQLRGVIKTYKELMAGQLGGLKRQYEQSTMRGDFDSLLSPDAQAQLETIDPRRQQQSQPQTAGQGDLSPQEQQELETLRARFGKKP